MKTIHLESQRVGRKIEIEMRRGKSIFEALAVATMEAHDRQERQKKAITGMWIDGADKVPNTLAQGREPHRGEVSPGATGSTAQGEN